MTRKIEDPKVCVLMPFCAPFYEYYEAIYAPALTAAGLQPVRVDIAFARSSQINADVEQMIDEATIVLAVLTTLNPNVMYEAGIARGRGKPLVFVCEGMADVPSDLQPFRVLLYNKDDCDWGRKLRKRITRAIEESLSAALQAP